jgi:hypothetical protein
MTFHKSGAKKAVISSASRFIRIPNEDFQDLANLWTNKVANIDCTTDIFCFAYLECSAIAQLVGPFILQFSSYEYFSVQP